MPRKHRDEHFSGPPAPAAFSIFSIARQARTDVVDDVLRARLVNR